jgi:hypothetical protein
MSSLNNQWKIGIGLELWCLIPLSTIFLLSYCGIQFYWCRKPEYPEKTTDLPQVTDIHYHILLYSYNFNPIKNTHLRHVTVHYFSVLYNRKPYFFRIGSPDKSVFFSYCTLCKGINSLIFVICFLELV